MIIKKRPPSSITWNIEKARTITRLIPSICLRCQSSKTPKDLKSSKICQYTGLSLKCDDPSKYNCGVGKNFTIPILKLGFEFILLINSAHRVLIFLAGIKLKSFSGNVGNQSCLNIEIKPCAAKIAAWAHTTYTTHLCTSIEQIWNHTATQLNQMPVSSNLNTAPTSLSLKLWLSSSSATKTSTTATIFH